MFILVVNANATTDRALNGTWVDEGGNETTFNDGNFKVFVPSINSYGGRGIFSTNDGKITQITTHVFGDGLNYILKELILLDLMPPSTFRFSEKWYSSVEIQTELNRLECAGLLDIFLIFFSEITADYHVDGNLLILTIDGERTTASRRKY